MVQARKKFKLELTKQLLKLSKANQLLLLFHQQLQLQQLQLQQLQLQQLQLQLQPLQQLQLLLFHQQLQQLFIKTPSHPIGDQIH